MAPPISSGIAPSSALTSGAPNDSQTSKRSFTSCRRCKTRKIKCDAGLQACTPCVKIGAACVDVTRTNHEVPRSINVELAERIVYLEGIIRRRLPDVDLSIGPGSAVMKALASDFEALVAQEQQGVPTAAQSAHDLPVEFENPAPPLHDIVPRASFASSSPQIHGSSSKRPRQELSLGPASSAQNQSPISTTSENISHAVGLVSLVGSSDTKYVGPSSGFSFAKLLQTTLQSSLADAVVNDDLFASQAPTPPTFTESDSDLDINMLKRRLKDYSSAEYSLPHPAQAADLIALFYRQIHCFYPCLHAPTFYMGVERVYQHELLNKSIGELDSTSHLCLFQFLMVLAISLRIDMGRTPVETTATATFNKAVEYMDYVCNGVNTVEKTQCLILVALYSLHSPAAPNAWTLSYHLMANCVDLGLQRNIGRDMDVSPVMVDLRKRLFWCVYTLDRVLSVALGRPLSLRDEGFDVEMPANTSDADLQRLEFDPSQAANLNIVTPMTPSIRFFEIMQIFTDIKLHLFRVCRDPNRFPWPTDLDAFRRKTLIRLNDWRHLASASTKSSSIRTALEFRYHQAVLLLFRPSPAIPTCTAEALDMCGSAARDMIRLSDSQQRSGRLPRTFLHIHDILLAGLMLLFGLLQSTPSSLPKNRYAPELRAASSILAALSDTWNEARRARNVLDKLADLILMQEQPATSSLPALTSPGQSEMTFEQIMQQLLDSTNPGGNTVVGAWDELFGNMPSTSGFGADLDFSFFEQPDYMQDSTYN